MAELRQITDEVGKRLRELMSEQHRREKDRKLEQFRQLNRYIRKGQTLFTGSSLMEMFPIAEFCANDGLPVVYNRGIGGYTTDEFLAGIDVMLLDPEPSKLFLNIGTNDIREMPDGEDWFEHLSRNERRICEIIRDRLPDTEVWLMAYYPVNLRRAAEAGWGQMTRTNEAVARANRMVEALAAEFGFHYIDVNDGLKDAAGDLLYEHTADGIHFDPDAYRTVYDRLKHLL